MENVLIKCPKADCLQAYKVEKYIQWLSIEMEENSKFIDEISNESLKHYMINQIDVRKCPTQGCDYAGFIDFK